MAVSPTVRRQRLARELRRRREALGLTIEQAAPRLGLHPSSLSRIERAESGVKLATLRLMVQEYSVAGPDAVYLEELRRQASQRGWWQSAGDLRDPTRTLIGLEAEASFINDFSSPVLTGLIQTSAYAEALLRSQLVPDDAISAAVETRTRRQQRLPEIRLFTILAVETLIRPVGGPEVMADQLEWLIELSSRDTLTIRVLDLPSGAHAGAGGGFSIIGFDPGPAPTAVYLEGNYWDVCFEEIEQLNWYSRLFEELLRQALTSDQSRDLLSRLEKDMRNGRYWGR
jgi:transcriptional regulator with XRE-family HTH domain